MSARELAADLLLARRVKNIFGAFTICLIVCFATCSSASACFNQLLSILFEDVPAHIDAPVIVEATIYDFSKVRDVTGIPLVIMNARVDKVIKGPVDVGRLTIRIHPSSCTHGGVGQGIVVGTLRDDPHLGLVLEANQGSDMGKWSKEFSQRQTDIWNAWKSK
jgi:hypothetical protein